MSSVRVRHPALEALLRRCGSSSSRTRIPSPERPAYGIYVARLVAALERDGHEVVLAASSEQGGGWRTLRKYARLAWRARAAARRQPSRRRLGPLPRADRDDRPPRCPRRRRVPYALTAHGTDVANAERSPRIRKATAPRSATPARSSRSRTTWPRAWRRSWARSATACTSSAPASIWRRSPTATRDVARAALGWDARRAARRATVGTLIPRKNLAAPARGLRGGARGVGRRLARARRRRAAAGRARGARGRARHRRTACASPGPSRPRRCRAGCAPATSPAWSPSVEGFGLAAIEALGCGRPVVVARSVPARARR